MPNRRPVDCVGAEAYRILEKQNHRMIARQEVGPDLRAGRFDEADSLLTW